jgi:hypothetical protein
MTFYNVSVSKGWRGMGSGSLKGAEILGKSLIGFLKKIYLRKGSVYVYEENKNNPNSDFTSKEKDKTQYILLQRMTGAYQFYSSLVCAQAF